MKKLNKPKDIVNWYIKRFRKLLLRKNSQKAIEKLRASVSGTDLIRAESKLARLHRNFVLDVQQALYASIHVFLNGSIIDVKNTNDSLTELKISYVNDQDLPLQLAFYINYDFDIAMAVEDNLGIQLLRPLEVVDLFGRFAEDADIPSDFDVANLPLIVALIVALTKNLDDYDSVVNLADADADASSDHEVAYHQYIASYGVPEDFSADDTKLVDRLIRDTDYLLGGDVPSDLKYLEYLSVSMGSYIGADSDELVEADLYRGLCHEALMNDDSIDLHTPTVHDWAETIICMIRDLKAYSVKP